MYLYIKEISTVNIIYHPSVLKERERILQEKEHEVALNSYLNTIDRKVIEEERRKIDRAKKIKLLLALSFFVAGFLSGLIF
tara:strand:- start:150 stop:392 length:243 start_codon:yes stop_codon:yes gene_type:complete